MLTKAKGIVLHQIKFKENSAIVHMYTDQYGRQAYLVNDVRGKKSKFRANILQPFYILELEVYYKPEREIQRVKELQHFIHFRTIPYDPVKRSQVIFLAEVLYRSLREEESNEGLFDFLMNSIQWLDTTMKHYSKFHIMFLIQLTKYLGFKPENNFSQQHSYFDLRNGQFTGNVGINPEIIEKEESQLLHDLLDMSYSDLPYLLINPQIRDKLIDSILSYYELHIQGFGKFRSLEILKEIFK